MLYFSYLNIKTSFLNKTATLIGRAVIIDGVYLGGNYAVEFDIQLIKVHFIMTYYRYDFV